MLTQPSQAAAQPHQSISLNPSFIPFSTFCNLLSRTRFPPNPYSLSRIPIPPPGLSFSFTSIVNLFLVDLRPPTVDHQPLSRRFGEFRRRPWTDLYQLLKASLNESDAFAFFKADEPGDYITYPAFCEGLRLAARMQSVKWCCELKWKDRLIML
ncbi:uncharacterized protein LOC110614290 isoform X1 [Manihot esculenta]|nr:uncharacterized protein LOC110614290 isoform X1 [Manihot esculenta]